jgi:hypothetical protein
MDRNLVVCSNQIDLEEEATTWELVRIVMDVTDRIAIWYGTGVQRSQGRQPLAFLGTMWIAEDQELFERRAVPSHNMASNSALAMASLSGNSRRGRQVTGGPDVVRMWWTMLWRTSRWTPVGRGRSGNSERMLSTGILALMTLTLGIGELAAWAGADKDVTQSSRRLFLQSTSSP